MSAFSPATVLFGASACNRTSPKLPGTVGSSNRRRSWARTSLARTSTTVAPPESRNAISDPAARTWGSDSPVPSTRTNCSNSPWLASIGKRSLGDEAFRICRVVDAVSQ